MSLLRSEIICAVQFYKHAAPTGAKALRRSVNNSVAIGNMYPSRKNKRGCPFGQPQSSQQDALLLIVGRRDDIDVVHLERSRRRTLEIRKGFVVIRLRTNLEISRVRKRVLALEEQEGC